MNTRNPEQLSKVHSPEVFSEVTDNILVSVIIPVYEDIRVLDCVNAIANQGYPRHCIEIIVVQNITPMLEEIPGVTLVYEPLPGSYRARNTGVKVSHGEVIAFTDADCLPATSWLEEAVIIFRDNPAVAAIGGEISLFTKDAQKPTAAELFELVWGFPQKEFVENKNFAATANLIVRASVLNEVGAFREEMMSGGDQEWGGRSAKLGLQMVFSDKVIVYHPARHRLSELIKKYERTCGGQYQLRKARGEGHFHTVIKLIKKPFAAFFNDVELRSVADRGRYAGVQFILSTIQFAEIFRLACGGRPRNQ